MDTGGDALTKTTTYTYDQDLNRTSTNEHAYYSVSQATGQTGAIGSITPGALLRSTEVTYYVNDPDIDPGLRAAYRARNLLALPTSTKVRDGSGTLVAQSVIRYDEAAYPVLPYSLVKGWTDPGGTTPRGNATTVGSWLNTTGLPPTSELAYLKTHAQYDQCGSLRKAWDAKGNQSQVEYSGTYEFAYPTLNTSADPDGGGPLTTLITSTEYDFSTGLVTATIDANQQRTTFSYNDPLTRLKQVVRATDDAPVKNQTSYDYNDAARKITVTSDLNIFNDNVLKTETLYDGLGRTVETRTYEGASNYIVVQQQYDTLGRIFKVSNPFRNIGTPDWTTTGFDALGRVISLTTPDNAVLSTAYSGNKVLVTDQALKQRMSQTDVLGRLTDVWEIKAADTATEAITFPGHSEVTAGYRTRYAYDALDNLLSVSQQLGTTGTTQSRNFIYDSLKRVTSATNPESGTILYLYDDNSNLLVRTDARGVSTHITYDAVNRPVRRWYNGSSSSSATLNNDPALPAGVGASFEVNYSYDAAGVSKSKGRLTTVTSNASSYSYSGYDALGRVLGGTQATDGQSYTMSYSYDLAGNIKSQSYPSGRVVASEYDAAGRLAGVKNQANGLYYAGAAETDSTNRLQYTAHGAPSQMRLGNGLWEHTNFNTRLQPTQIGLGTSSTNSSVLQLDYSYGATANNSNVLSQTITVPTIGAVTGFTATQTYTYDALNRLATAQENTGASWTQNFGYDRYGNRNFAGGTTSPVPLSASNNPVINPNNNRIDIAAGGQTSYGYDGAGNLTHDATVHTYAYDAENKLTTYDGGATSNGGATYLYDGDGRRVKKVVGGATIVTTVFVYNVVGKLVAEYSNASPSSPGGTSYLTSDTLGSPRVITGVSQGVKARHDYLPFGEEIGGPQVALVGGRTTTQGYTGDNVRQKFTSKERDNETGLDFFEARYSSSVQGRFTSVDPYNIVREAQITGQIRPDKARAQLSNYLMKPQQWNRYAYVVNNPLKYVDPTGELIELTGTEAEREDALKRLKILVGKEAAKHLSIREENGHYYVKADVNLCDVSGPGDSGTLNYYMSELIDRKDHTVEFKIADSFTTKFGSYTTAGKDCGGACTVGSEESTTGNTQIFVNRHASAFAELAMKTPVNAGKYVGGNPWFEEDIVDAHEFGHAYANAIEGKPLYNSRATDDRANEWENLQRGTYASPVRRVIH